MIRTFPWALLVQLVALGIASAAAAAEKVAIRPNVSADTSWTFLEIESANMNSTVKAAGQQQQMQQKFSRRMTGRADVLEANAGKPTALRVTFDRDCGGEVDSGPAGRQPMPFSLAGRTITLKLSPDGRVNHDAGQLALDDEQQLQSMLDGDDAFLPKEPVGVGDTWSPDAATLARKFQVDPTKTKLSMNMTLKEFKDVGGRRAAVVDVALELMGEMQGMTGQRRLSGIAMVDLQTGRVFAADMSGAMSMSGVQQQQSPDGQVFVMEVQSQGNVTVKSELKFAAANSAPPAGGGMAGGILPGQQPSAPSPFAPAPRVTPAAPPTPPPQGTFTFRDETITLMFTSDARVPGGRGMITMGEKQFPVQVSKWDGTSLAGTFESEGNQFEFTGQLNGETLVFKTGETEYQLKSLPAKKNPLAK